MTVPRAYAFAPGAATVVLLLTVPGPLAAPLAAQHVEAAAAGPEEGIDYRVYRWDGTPARVANIVGAAAVSDALLLGEEHDDMVAHGLQTSILQSVLGDERVGGAGRTVVLSLEMFERDVQYVLDEYLEGLVSETHFLRSARPWDEYRARYRPVVEVARTEGAPVIAANAPRRYVNLVTREGPDALDSLSDLARSYLPPLPYPGPSEAYRTQWEEIMSGAMQHVDGSSAPSGDDGASSHGPGPNAIHAQALWDASMGHAIATALVDHLGSLVVHLAGSFHVARGTGIPERIADYRPGTRVTTVVMTKVADVDRWSEEDHRALADFVVLTREPTAASRSPTSPRRPAPTGVR